MSKLGLLQAAGIVLVLCITTAIAAPAQTFNNLLSFDATNGAQPWYGSLVQGTDGNFYGTTSYGGTEDNYGTVFKITPAGTVTTLHLFDGKDGYWPFAALVQSTDGNFYGTTYYGGEQGGVEGSGTVFEITPGGTLTTLHVFCTQSGCEDGAYPAGPLVQATNGNFYGITVGGGANGSGTVFKITPKGKLTGLYSFCSQTACTDGGGEWGSLVQATNGNFYGITGGGANGEGVVFKITPAGKFTTLYSFCSQTKCADGAEPWGGLIQATNGNLYGTTEYGGANNYGTVFKITTAGKLTTLHSFDYNDGYRPFAGLAQATDGNFYGTTGWGGRGDYGAVFEITPGGTLTTLHSFCPEGGSCTDGSYPFAGLMQATNGILYGMTSTGGTYNDGTVFSLSVGLGPFVETLPTSGKVGAKVIILGNNLKGTTSVTFNGTAATFTVVSNTEIKTTVPSGATTGPVQVTTPGGTLNSNVVFRVEP